MIVKIKCECKMQYMGSAFGEVMAIVKTATLTFRINPGLKEALRVAAEREHRSISNMVEVLIRDYCEQHNITISPLDVAKHDKSK
ncbi:ribbon-helix-helix protein, CopG family [Aeromonas veronii]|uniref:ribbon-helix-helix protein, CopG family n=1 Tax=Aeromonas veronii TaxID=654 RepID=UPI001F3D49C7|nr:ribbon-helix-helix protein, CopG family [Aeromonas veronii]